MREVTRYLLWQLVEATLFVTLALAGVVWLSQSLRFVDLIINRGLSFFTFLQLTFLLLPSFLAYLLPVALFCAVVYTYQRLNADSEIVVLRAVGLGPTALMKPALFLAAGVTVACYAITLYLQPAGFREFKDRQFTIRGDYSRVLLQEGTFNALGDGLTVYFRARQPNGELDGILVHDNRDPAAPVTRMAERGMLVATDKGPLLSLVNGNQQEIDPDRRKITWLYFDGHNVDLSELIETQATRWREPRERYLHELFGPPVDINDRNYLEKLRAEGHHRLVSPLYSVVFALLGLAAVLGGEFSRRGQAPRLLIAGGVAAIFLGLAMGLVFAIVKSPALTPLVYANVVVWIGASLYALFRSPRPRRQAVANETAGGAL